MTNQENIPVMTLEKAQDSLYALMCDVGKIYSQLHSEGFKKGIPNQAEYENWEARAMTAYEHKSALLAEMRSYVKAKFGVSYSSPEELRVIIMRRNLQAPDWMQENGHSEFSNEGTEIEASKPDPQANIETQAVQQLRPLSPDSERRIEQILARLTEARKQAKLTQGEVGAEFGFSNAAIGFWERGRTSPKLADIFRLCEIYGVEPLYILTGETGVFVSKRDLETIAQQFHDGMDMLRTLWED